MTAADFKNHILQRFFQDVQGIEQDNYSAERFSYDGVDRSAVFDVAKHASYLEWFIAQYANLFDTYCNLADEESRDLYIDLLRFKLAGHLHVRIDTPVARLREETARFYEAFPGRESALHMSGMFGKLRHYDGVWNSTRYTADTIKNALASTLVNRQYYFERNGISIRPEPGDYVIDGGACTGDTAIVFSRSAGPQGQIYAFDPVQSHLDVCETNFSRPEYGNINLLPFGLSDIRIEAPPVRLDAYSPGFRVDEATVPLARIDDMVIDRQIERIDFIKLDIEGSEMAALRGACASIHRFKPKLAISIYHKPNDFYEILQYVHGLGLGYKFYLGHYTTWDEETLLYAICTASPSQVSPEFTPSHATNAMQRADLEQHVGPPTVSGEAGTSINASGHIDAIDFVDAAASSHDAYGTVPVGAMLAVRGWAAITDDPARSTGVFVRIDDGPPFEAFGGLGRRDVAVHFKNEAFSNCGFRAVFSAVHLSPGQRVVTLLARDDNGNLIAVDQSQRFTIEGLRSLYEKP